MPRPREWRCRVTALDAERDLNAATTGLTSCTGKRSNYLPQRSYCSR